MHPCVAPARLAAWMTTGGGSPASAPRGGFRMRTGADRTESARRSWASAVAGLPALLAAVPLGHDVDAIELPAGVNPATALGT